MPIKKLTTNSKKKLTGLGLVMRHEGFELDPYYLEYGKTKEKFLTGGIGHKMDDSDMQEFNYNWSDQEKKDYWLDKFNEDYERANVAAIKHATNKGIDLTEGQEKVLTSMSFQLGENALGNEWPSFMEALAGGDYEEAVTQMKTGKGGRPSKWYNQTPERVDELAEIIRSGD